MGNTQDMNRRQGRTQASADNRVSQLHAQGHHVTINGANEAAIVTITRREGFAHYVMVTPEMLPEGAREGAAFKRFPQSVLIAFALHTVADWSAEIDRRAIAPCHGCGRPDNTTANYNHETGEYEWFCPTCVYGAYEEAVA